MSSIFSKFSPLISLAATRNSCIAVGTLATVSGVVTFSKIGVHRMKQWVTGKESLSKKERVAVTAATLSLISGCILTGAGIYQWMKTAPKIVIGTCKEQKILKKWQVTCNEYHRDPQLKKLINSPEVYKGKKAFGHKTARTFMGKLMFLFNGKLVRWSKIKKDLKNKKSLTWGEKGVMGFGQPFVRKHFHGSTRSNYKVCVVTRKNLQPYPHSHIRLINGADIESYGFYPKKLIGGVKSFLKLAIPTEGRVVSPDPVEYEMKGHNMSQTCLSVKKEQWESARSHIHKVAKNPGKYQILSVGGKNCKTFSEGVLSAVKIKDAWSYLPLPRFLGGAIKNLGKTVNETLKIKVV